MGFYGIPKPVNIATNKKWILSGKNWACTCIHFVWQTSGYHRISEAWGANESKRKWIFTGLVIHNILSTRMCTFYQGVLVKSKSGGNQGRPFDNWLWSNKNLIGLQTLTITKYPSFDCVTTIVEFKVNLFFNFHFLLFQQIKLYFQNMSTIRKKQNVKTKLLLLTLITCEPEMNWFLTQSCLFKLWLAH